MPFQDDAPKVRLIKLLCNLAERPAYYSIKSLSQKYNVSNDTIKRDIESIRSAGLDIQVNSNYTYSISSEAHYEYLRNVLFFSESDRNILIDTLQASTVSAKKKEELNKKIQSIYDLSTAGNHLLSPSFLSINNLLQKAKEQKKSVKLINYRSSNSRTIKDRKVEPFHILTKEDILQAYDLDKKEIKHFRISRIGRVEIQEEIWSHQKNHIIISTDAFGIVDPDQHMIHIRLTLSGYNELIERYPASKAHITPSGSDKDIFEFQSNVNHKFYGLAKFILGNYEDVIEIIRPDELKEIVNKSAQKINF